MKGVFFVIVVFLTFGMVSLAISLIERAALAVILLHIGYLLLVSATGYIQWKKYRHP